MISNIKNYDIEPEYDIIKNYDIIHIIYDIVYGIIYKKL